jgi:uncharacterized glyoxalase superfamily protein PhnB
MPFLTYDEPEKAIEWLQEAFGFQKLSVALNPAGQVMHAELRTGSSVVLLTPAKGGGVLPMCSPRDLPFVNQGVFVHIPREAVDKHYEQALAAGAKVILPLEDKVYGSREYTCADIEGHLWSFGTYAPSFD